MNTQTRLQRHAVLVIIGGALLMIAIALPAQKNWNTVFAKVVERPEAESGKWRTIWEPDVASGSTVPAGINTFFHIPDDIVDIHRETLIQSIVPVRYWGYCLEDENDPLNRIQTQGFPGKLFLSEAEREWRRKQEDLLTRVSPLRPPTKGMGHAAPSPIRHQLDILHGGMTCYIMSEKELAIGTDIDKDGLNSKMEQKNRTSPYLIDSDGDGLDDGKEIFMNKTDPTLRDTDSDGLIDGIEDGNQDGQIDSNETSPKNKDTDGDGICDGYCRVFKVREICKDSKGLDCVDIPYGKWIGEDKNLNGKIDTGETDPRVIDSDGDGIQDDQEFYKCLMDRKPNC